MTTIGQLKERIKRLDQPQLAAESIDQTKDQIIVQQQAQLFSGLTRDETSIKPPYAARTVAIKKKKGQPSDRVTLRDTGAFYKNIFVEVREQNFITDSLDEKSGDLQQKYGGSIFGLGTTRRTEYVQETLQPVFLDRVKKALQL